MIRAPGVAALLSLAAAATAQADPVMRFAVAAEGFDVAPIDILQAEAEPADIGAVLYFRFGPRAARDLRDLTSVSIGKPMDLVVCDEVLISPVIMDVIAGGVGQINLGTLEEARILASVLHGDATCDDYHGT